MSSVDHGSSGVRIRVQVGNGTLAFKVGVSTSLAKLPVRVIRGCSQGILFPEVNLINLTIPANGTITFTKN